MTHGIREAVALLALASPHRYDPALESGVYVLGAVSSDGITWTKQSEPLLEPGMHLAREDPASSHGWMRSGAAEPDVLLGPDGKWYLFFTGLDDSAGTRSIGLARSDEPEGPYRIDPEPILSPSSADFDAGAVLAPDVLLDGSRLRLWYNAMGVGESSWLIGYAERPWPP